MMRILLSIFCVGLYFTIHSQTNKVEVNRMKGSTSYLSIQYDVDTLSQSGIYLRKLDTLECRIIPYYYFRQENGIALTFYSGVDSTEKAKSLVDYFNEKIREGHLFYLANNSEKPISFYTNEGPKFIAEAVNKNEEWKPIELQLNSTCGFSSDNVSLSPGQIIFFSANNYDGNFKTKLRLKLETYSGILYSKEFIGIINEEQFRIPKYLKKYIRKSFSKEDPFLEDLPVIEK